MSTYPLEKLLHLWKSTDMSSEQLAGHLLQNVILLEKQLTALGKRLAALEKGGKQVETLVKAATPAKEDSEPA